MQSGPVSANDSTVRDSFLNVGGEDPRFAFMEEIIRAAADDDRIVMLDADVSRRTLSRRFRDAYPDRFWDVGVAEQNLMGITAGLAAAGRIPIACAFAVFVSMRAVEPIRNSVCYPALNAKLVGGYAGLSNGKDGATHQSIEDVAIMRSLAGLVVLSPSDSSLATAVARAALDHQGPVYVRIEYEETPRIHPSDVRFRIGQGIRVREGRDVTIATYGIALARAVEASRTLAQAGIEAEILDMASIKPFDSELLIASTDRTRRLVTLEDHTVIGGLASAAAEALLGARRAPAFRALGIPDRFTESGTNDALRARFGLDARSLVAAARTLVEEDARP